jgi:hypothetical protein
VYAVILIICFVFLLIVSLPLINQNFTNETKLEKAFRSDRENQFLQKLNEIPIKNSTEYDSLINKAIAFQKLLNAKNEQNISYNKSIEQVQKVSFSDYISYAIFILIFGVFTSLYRFHLKEISKHEHYLIGFQRIRIAGVNSSTKYDDEVKISLTKNAFYYESEGKAKQSDKSIESPIQGHPASDIATNLLNKILEKFEFKPKK